MYRQENRFTCARPHIMTELPFWLFSLLACSPSRKSWNFVRGVCVFTNPRHVSRASQVALVVKNLPANAGDMRHGFDLWVGKIPWRKAWQPSPVFFSLWNPMDREAWWATVHGVAKSWTWLKPLSMQHMGVKSNWKEFPGGPVVKTSPSNAGVQVQSLIGKLRSHIPWSQKTKTWNRSNIMPNLIKIYF